MGVASGKRKAIVCALAAVAAVALVALTVPAGASASRLVVCLQGKAQCTGANKLEAPISPELTENLLGGESSSRGQLTWFALDACANTIGPQLTGALQNLGVDAEICGWDGHWAFGFVYWTRVGELEVGCGAPRTHNPAISYRYCEVKTSNGATPYVLIEDKRGDYPYPLLP